MIICDPKTMDSVPHQGNVAGSWNQRPGLQVWDEIRHEHERWATKSFPAGPWISEQFESAFFHEIDEGRNYAVPLDPYLPIGNGLRMQETFPTNRLAISFQCLQVGEEHRLVARSPSKICSITSDCLWLYDRLLPKASISIWMQM